MSEYNFLSFSWMLNMWVNDFLNSLDELSVCNNVYQKNVWELRTVPWYSKVVATTIGWNITFLHEYYRNSTLDYYMLAWYTSWSDMIIKRRGVWTWWTTLTTITWAASSTINAVTYIDKVFWLWNNWTTFISPFTIEWTSYSTADTDLSDMPSGKYIVRYNDLLYVLNAKIWSDNYPSRWYYCSAPVGWDISWFPTTDFIEFGQDDWEEITWWAVASWALVVFKENSMWTWNENSIQKIYDIWCENNDSIQVINWALYWYNKDWMWRWAWWTPQLISRKMQWLIDSVANASSSWIVSIKDWNEYKLYVWTHTVNWFTYNNTWLCFDSSTETFYTRTSDYPAYSTVIFTELNKKRAYFWTDSWLLLKINREEDSVALDVDKAIFYTFKTPYLSFDLPYILKRTPNLYLYSKNPNWINFSIDIDYKNEYNESRWSMNTSGIHEHNIWTTGYLFSINFYWNWQTVFNWFTIEINNEE